MPSHCGRETRLIPDRQTAKVTHKSNLAKRAKV